MSKDTGLQVNTDKIKYMFMFWDQNAEQNHNSKADNRSSEGWNISNIWEQP